MSISGDELAHSQHLVFFLDLLGSKEAVDGTPQQLSALTKLLKDLKAGEGEFKIDPALVSRNSVASTEPAISTFSDHAVISFNMDALRSETKIPYRAVVGTAKLLVGGLAYRAFKAGLLLRGGATLNSLYHKQGVVVGKALIEAYDLERSVSVYPRIAVSQPLADALSEHLLTPIQTDSDGVKYFDYLGQMLLTAGGIGGGPVRRAWYDDACKLAQERIEYFKNDRHRQAKWQWFLDKLQKARSSMSDGFFK